MGDLRAIAAACLAAVSAAPVVAGEATFSRSGKEIVLPDDRLAPGQAKSYKITLSAGQAEAAPPLKFAAYLDYMEAGMNSALKIAVNGHGVGDEFLPLGKPKLLSLPNHGLGKTPMYDAASGAWTLFYDDDLTPPAKDSRYYCPEEKDYILAFPVGKLLRAGENAVELRNISDQYAIRIVTEKTWEAEMSATQPAKSGVPADRLKEAIGGFPPPDPAKARQRFLDAHKALESTYNGDGSWGKGYSSWSVFKDKKECTHPLVRWTGNPVVAYLIAGAVEPDPVYARRAKEGLEWLLKEQDAGGAFRWYWEPKGTIDGNSIYDTGVAGYALVRGYEAFGDKRLLDASAKAAKWSMAAPVTGNANYDFFAVRHLAAHYRATKDAQALESAVQKTVATLKNQTPQGYWSDDHNQQICYHCICTDGLVELLSVLPPDHPRRKTIEAGTYRAVNHIIGQQKPDGSLRVHVRGGDWKGYAPGASFATPVLVKARRQFGWALDDALAGLVDSPAAVNWDKPETWDTMLDELSVWHAAGWQYALERSKQPTTTAATRPAGQDR